jgi:hypothetical protein
MISLIADPTNPAREDIKDLFRRLTCINERLEIMFVTSVIIAYLNLQQGAIPLRLLSARC